MSAEVRSPLAQDIVLLIEGRQLSILAQPGAHSSALSKVSIPQNG